MSRERTAALAGVLYVVLDVVVGVWAGSPPPPAAPQAQIVAYVADHRAGLAARQQLLPRWLTVVGLGSAAAFLTSAVLGALTTDATSNTIGLVGFVLWLAWILGASYHLNVRTPSPMEMRQESAPPARLDRALPR